MLKTKNNPWNNGKLHITENNRYLAHGDTPFFWLGDTAWLLFEKLNQEQSYRYLKNRAHMGFTVIQATLVHNLVNKADGTNNTPTNPNNTCLALEEGDFARPNLNGDYWNHIDGVVTMAENLGLMMALLPAWGDLVRSGHLNEQNAAQYGKFLAKRFGTRPNVIWLIGGDIRGSEGLAVFHTLASTIKKYAPDQLMGYHPFGRTSSSQWFKDAQWLDFNMFQSGHRRYDQASLGSWDDNAEKEGWFGEDNWKYVQQDYESDLNRPTLDGEPSYEQIPHGLHDPRQPYWQDYDVRRFAWWSVLQGACGHTYGHNAIMQFHQQGETEGSFGVISYWDDAIHAPGAAQMTYLSKLMCSLDFTKGKQAQHLLMTHLEKHARIAAFSGTDFALFYSYTGYRFGIHLPLLHWDKADAWWFDPALGVESYIGILDCCHPEFFLPPKKPSGQNDWVLLLRLH